MREPETLGELYSRIVEGITSEEEEVTIRLTEGDGVHELLAELSDAIRDRAQLSK